MVDASSACTDPGAQCGWSLSRPVERSTKLKVMHVLSLGGGGASNLSGLPVFKDSQFQPFSSSLTQHVIRIAFHTFSRWYYNLNDQTGWDEKQLQALSSSQACRLTRAPDTAMSSSVLMLTLTTSSVCPYSTWIGLGWRPTGAPPWHKDKTTIKRFLISIFCEKVKSWNCFHF